MIRSLQNTNKIGRDNIFLFFVTILPLFYMYPFLMGFDTFYKTLISGVTYFLTLYAIIKSKHKLNFMVIILVVISFLGFIIHYVQRETNLYYFVYFMYSLAVFTIIKNSAFKREKILYFTNVSYVLYLLLSILTWTGYIQLTGRELNIFNIDLFDGLINKTLIGYYGSTAQIDSYSAFIAILNLFYNKNIKSKIFIIVISSIAGVLTLRLTPLLSLIGSFIFAYIFRNRVFIPNVFLFFSFYFPYQISKFIGSHSFDILMESITHGRYLIWNGMLDLYLNFNNLIGILFGFGNTKLFAVPAFSYILISNPHNSFLRALIENGLFIFLIIFFSITRGMKNLSVKSRFVIYFILFASVTNSDIFDYDFPIYLVWIIYEIVSNKKKEG